MADGLLIYLLMKLQEGSVGFFEGGGEGRQEGFLFFLELVQLVFEAFVSRAIYKIWAVVIETRSVAHSLIDRCGFEM